MLKLGRYPPPKKKSSRAALNKIDEVWNSANPLFKWRFGLLSCKNCATMTTWRNDLSSLLSQLCGAVSPLYVSITFKFGNSTNFKALFPVASTDSRYWSMSKVTKTVEQSAFCHFSTPGVAIKESFGDRVVTKYCIVSEKSLCTLYDLFVKVNFSHDESRSIVFFSVLPPHPIVLALLRASLFTAFSC